MSLHSCRLKLTVKLPANYERIQLPFYTKWINALESGKYFRAEESLFDEDTGGYCCLGVLSKVQGRLEDGNDNGISGILHSNNPSCRKNVMGVQGNFPKNVIVSNRDRTFEALTELNDIGYSFKTIAGIIKQIWKA